MDDQIAVLGPQSAALTAPELTIVVPTFNERDNIRPLLDLIAKALDGDNYEVVFVDDDEIPEPTILRTRKTFCSNS